RAVNHLLEGMKHLPNDLLAVYNTANLLLDADAVGEAKKLMAIKRDDLNAGLLDYLAARIHLSNQEWAKALELLDRARTELSRPPEITEILKQAHLLVGECHRRLGNPDQHLDAVRLALRLDPSYVEAKFSLAVAV